LWELAAAQSRAGRSEEARLTFAQALDAAQGLAEPRSRAGALREIAAACVDGGDVATAQKCLQEALLATKAIWEEDARAESFQGIAGLQAKARLADEALVVRCS
jgi:hypothetical protein